VSLIEKQIETQLRIKTFCIGAMIRARTSPTHRDLTRNLCPLPVEKFGSRTGSLESDAEVTWDIPSVTFELPRNTVTQPPELLRRFYGEALIQALLHRRQEIE
jgi:hypothetical protein